MDQNPYASPESDPPELPHQSNSGELLPLWIWLAGSVLASWLSAPADPISMIMALGCGLVCFCAGAVLGSRVYLGMLAAIICLALSALLPVVSFGWGWPYSAVVSVVYGFVSIVAGAWACRSIQHGRLRILISFSLGYVIGCLFGVLGVVVGAVAGAILAKRSLVKLSAPSSV